MSALDKVCDLTARITGSRLDYCGGKLYVGPWQIMRRSAFDQHELKMFHLGRDEEAEYPSIEGVRRRLRRDVPGANEAADRGDWPAVFAAYFQAHPDVARSQATD